MGLDAETHGIRQRESLGWSSSSAPFPKSSGSPTEIVEKEWWESEWTLGEQGPWTQLSSAHWESQRLKRQSQSLPGSALGPLHIW